MYQKGVVTEWILKPPFYKNLEYKPYGELIDLSSNIPRKGDNDVIDIYRDNPMKD